MTEELLEIDGKITKEQQQILNLLEKPDNHVKTYTHDFATKHIKIGIISDSHIGLKAFDEALWVKAMKDFKRRKVEAIYFPGDITEGMSGRPGHIYELSHIGYTNQMDYTSELMKLTDLPIYALTGNHDQWAFKKNNAGVDVGKELEYRVKNFHNLGMNEADVLLNDKFKMKLIHPNDGSAYAPGYKLMKMIESFGGGEKPNILLQGHYHKSLYMFSRNIHAYECGTICGQSEFMRLKKIQAHKGYWILDIYTGEKSIERIVNTFVPKYD